LSSDVIEMESMKQSWPKAVQILAAGGSNTDAARAAQVTTRTIARWRADEVAFADAIDHARTEMLTEAAGILAVISTKAARKLGDIVESEDDRHALSAARTVLDMASRYRIDQVLERRIASLEMLAGVRGTE
jgi:hypothetical protein